MEINVHETAFIIALYRARNEAESKDSFAHLWLRPGLGKWADDFADKVSPFDEILHCMRNRVIHDTIQEFSSSHSPSACVNLGAGFSMYPYVLPEDMMHLEVDFEEIITYKEIKTVEFTASGELPSRQVIRMSGNITNSYDQLQIEQAISDFRGMKKIVVIEGVFYFLNQEEVNSVLGLCRQIMEAGDQLLCVSFDSTIAGKPVFKRMQEYFSEELNSDGNTTSIPHTFYSTLPDFRLLQRRSTLEAARELGLVPEELEESEVLNEYIYLLEKQ